MKFRLTILLSIALTALSLNLYSQSVGIKEFENKFNIILIELDSVINNSGVENEVVQKHFNYIKNKIFSKELPIVYDSTLTYDFFACSAFNISKENQKEVSLSYGNFVFDKYEKYPCLIYAVLINSFQYAYDFYTKQDLFLVSLSNNIEKIYFEIDAMTLESIFLNDYCKNKGNLGYVEKYLMSDLKNGLAGSATLFKKTDIDLLHKMDRLKKKESSSSQLLNELQEIGNELVKNTSFENKSAWENYCSVVTLRTYVFYSQQVIFDIVHMKNNVSLESFKLENYPDNLNVINEIRKIVNERNEYFKFHNETLKKFSEYYK